MPVINYEELNASSDSTTTRTLLHEVIPVTGTIVSGTYGSFPSDDNIKNYTHGMFQSVYDYPYLSSSANHIFDISIGYANASSMSGASSVQNAKKINMYNQMAQVLLGYSGSTSEIETFESDFTFDNTNQMSELFFLSLSRPLVKDQIKKGSFEIQIGTSSWDTGNAAGGWGPFGTGSRDSGLLVLGDVSASATDNYKNTQGGDFGLLYSKNNDGSNGTVYGVIYYQAGIVALSSSMFKNKGTAAGATADFLSGTTLCGDVAKKSVDEALTGSAISGACDALRHRIKNLSFNNTTEINSRIYFCRVPHNKYNYSSNPTYVSASKIRVKNVASDQPVSYITTIGLYNSSNELLATAKLSEPLRKDPNNELTLRVRLDY